MIIWEGKSLGGVAADNPCKDICVVYEELCNRDFFFSVTINLAPFFLAETVSKIQKNPIALYSRFKPNNIWFCSAEAHSYKCLVSKL